MKISDIKAAIVEAQEVYVTFDIDAYNKSIEWLVVLNGFPPEEEKNFDNSATISSDIIEILEANRGLFQDEPYVPEIIEGFQEVEEDEKDNPLKNDNLLLEEENRNLNSLIEILNNQVEALQEELARLKIEAASTTTTSKFMIWNDIAPETGIIPVEIPEFGTEHPETTQPADTLTPPAPASYGAVVEDELPRLPQINVGALRDHEEDEEFRSVHPEELEDHEFEQPEASTPKRTKLTVKKIGLIAATLVIAGFMIYTLLAPRKETPLQLPKQPPMLPATLPIQQQMSAKPAPQVTQPVQPVQPIQPVPPEQLAAAPAAPAPTATPVKLQVQPPKEEKAHATKTRLKYNKAGNAISLIPNKGLKVYLSKDEQLNDVEGKDTDNWQIKYDKNKNYLTITSKNENSTNVIIIKTSKRDYMLNATADNKSSNKPIEFLY